MTVEPEGYRELGDQLRLQIERGAEGFRPGQMMPSEAELVRDTGLSRDTVRRALQGIRADGLAASVKGKGLRIRALPVITRDAQRRFDSRAEGGAHGAYEAELSRNGLGMHLDQTEILVVPAPEEFDGYGFGGEVLTRSRKMYAVRPGDPDPHPVQLAVSWIPMDLAEGTPIQDIDSGPGGTYSRLQDLGHKPELFEETITVRRASAYEAQFLRTDDEQRVYFIRRKAFEATGRIVEITDTVTPVHAQILVYRWHAE